MHRDLEPKNILISHSGHAVISGFEHAKPIGSSRSPTMSYDPIKRIESSRRTSVFQAPEVSLGWSHDYAVDCWSFGVILYMMLFNRVCSELHTRKARWFPSLCPQHPFSTQENNNINHIPNTGRVIYPTTLRSNDHIVFDLILKVNIDVLWIISKCWSSISSALRKTPLCASILEW